MKLDALEHPKILDFSALLGVSRPTALGHLELLWAWTGKHAPQGDIGKWPDGAIARACDWMGDPEVFLQSLLQSRLLDAHQQNRYVIHDWAEHAPRWVRAKLAKLKIGFVIPAVATVVPTTDDDTDEDVPTVEPSSQCSVVKGKEEESEPFSLESPPEGKLPKGNGKKPKAPETPLPDGFELDQELRKYVLQQIPDCDVDNWFEDYKLTARAKQWRYADWRLAVMTSARNSRPDSGHRFLAGQYPKKGSAHGMRFDEPPPSR